MGKETLKSPYDLVADALECKRNTLNESSSMGNHPQWDSVNHVAIIASLEEQYGIVIPDEEVMKYDNMKAIVSLYNTISA